MKPKIVQAILEVLRDEFDQRTRASRETRAAGNDAESKAENKYDTLSIEENYLADGLARQAATALAAAKALEKLSLHDFAPDEPIDLGALVELEFPDGREHFFLAPAAGGIEVRVHDRTITVITPDSPLGGQLLDRHAGEILPGKARILSVA